MQKSSDDIPGRLARNKNEASKNGARYAPENTLSSHERLPTPTATYLLPSARQLSHDDEPSSPMISRKRAASGSVSIRSNSPSDNGEASGTQSRKRHHRSRISNSSSNQSTASTCSEIPVNPERIMRLRQFTDDDLDHYHPQFAPHIPVGHRRSWPLIESAQNVFQGYPHHIEALDIASSISSTDSGIDIQEYDPADTGYTFDMAYIGAWSFRS